MTMVAKQDPRRLYPRAGSLVLCYDGLYFGPRATDTTKLTSKDQVTIELLPRKGSVHRIQVTQVVGDGKRAIQEVWTSKVLDIKPRGEKQLAKASGPRSADSPDNRAQWAAPRGGWPTGPFFVPAQGARTTKGPTGQFVPGALGYPSSCVRIKRGST